MSDPIVPVVVNPRAANGGARRYASRITKTLTRAGFRVSSQVTRGPMDAARIAREALSAGRELVLAVGGDGTVNEVVNGLLSGGVASPPSTALAVAQVGTGTDFSRTFGWTSDPEEVLDRLRRNRRLPIDVGRVEYTDLDGRPASRFFVNIAEFGSGGAVVEKVNRTTKVLGGRMSFLLAILSVMPTYRNQRVRYRIDGGREQDLVSNNFIVANGRFFGGGLMPAPRAELNDGFLDVIVIGDLDFRTIRRHLPDLRRGTHLSLDGVTADRGREIITETGGRALLDLDGELVGVDPIRFVCIPRAIHLVV